MTRVLLLLLVLLAACDPWWPCPDRPPVNGESCELRPDRVGDACDYGGDDHGQCTTSAYCNESPGDDPQPIWYVSRPDETCGILSSSCPAFGTLEGDGCVTGACEYAEGMCACLSCRNADGTDGAMWHCRAWSDVGPGCPQARPHAGDACDEDGVFCNYRDCCEGPSFGDDLACKGGVWQPAVNPACSCAELRCP